MSIWLVVSGEYSSYFVHAAFTEREQAEEFVTKQVGADDDRFDEWRVQERPLNPQTFEEVEAFEGSGWHVLMDLNTGEVVECSSSDEICESHAWRRVERFSVRLFAETREGAIKIANEKRIRWLAEHAAGVAR